MTVLIMAQGECSRFPGKHFATVRNETIIHRTCRLVKELDPSEQVIVVAPDTAEYRELPSLIYTQDNPGDGLLDGIYNTSELWLHGALILLGDVVYSRELLRFMLHDDREFVMYGRSEPNKYTGRQHAERYGLRVSVNTARFLYYRVGTPGWRAHCNGRLQGLWHRIQTQAVWHECDDWTDDVDIPSDLEAIRNHVQTLGDF